LGPEARSILGLKRAILRKKIEENQRKTQKIAKNRDGF
jgi:hypothetical protein